MPQENWKKIDELFHAALEVKNRNEREEFLREKSGNDAELYAEVRSLLDSLDKTDDFLEIPATEVGAKLFLENENGKFLGEKIGSHRIISELGRGGMGTVYLAFRDDAEFEQRVALKIVRERMATPALIERFRRERQILANLNHPFIARLLDGGTTQDGTPYFVMEYLRGANAVEYASRHNLSVNERLKLFLKICEAVKHAHEQGIIHRDIKPTNVLVTNEGEPKLLDFGIAKVLQENEREAANTMTGFRLFTPEYSSPEQARGENLSVASDIYSLGVLLYELLTTHQPFDFTNRSPLEIAQIVCENEPERPSTAIYKRRETVEENDFEFDESKTAETSRLLRGDLDNIVLKAMRKEPLRRYATVSEFAEDIENYLKNLPVKARPNSAFYRTGKFIKRNRAASVLAALLLISIIGFSAFSLMPKRTAKIYPASTIKPDEAVKLSNLSATEEYLSFSADGKNVFFVSNHQLYSVGIDGENLSLIKTNQPTLRVAESSDGKRFVFSTKDGIFVADKNFTNPKKVSDCSAGRFSWSPDAKQIVFGCPKNGKTNVFVADVETKNEQQLTDAEFCSDANFSPDGKRIAFTCETDKNLEIYAMNADGTNKIRLTTDAANDRLPIFSPDGKHLAFTSDRTSNDEIFIMNAETGEDVWRATFSKGSSNEAAWSADGKFIAFRSDRDGTTGVYLLNIEPKILAEKTSDEIEGAFSPDGKSIIYTSNRHGQFQIFRRDTDGKNSRQITWGDFGNGFPRYSPDGSKIVFSSNRDGLDELYLMNADGTNQVRLTETDAPSLRPAWSFDGKKIAFVKTIEENKEIFTLDLFSGVETRLTFDAKNDDFPAWTADGKIVFFSDRSGKNEVFQMNSDGSDIKNLTNNPANDGQMTVSKDGKIVFTSNRTKTMELWLMNADGSNQIQLTFTAPDGFNSRPQFSPDGTQIIYNSNEQDREILRVINLP